MNDTMTMTWAQFKKLAQTGIETEQYISLRLIRRFGISEGTPEWETMRSNLKGIRRILKVNSVGIHLETAGATKGTSEVTVMRAALALIADSTLTIYDPAIRALNDEESAFESKWKKVEESPEFQRQMSNDCLTDGNVCYWNKVRFYKNAGGKDMSYLMCSDKWVRGCLATYQHTGDKKEKMVRDMNIPGEEILRYEIIL